MGILNSVLKTFVGDKNKKDLARITPLVKAINNKQLEMEQWSADQLRAHTTTLKIGIQKARQEQDKEIDQLQRSLGEIEDIEKREAGYNTIDQLEDTAYQNTRAYLDEILPDAFALIKETARRFATQEFVTVSATPFDRELSQTRNYVKLLGDQAQWANSWDAAGKDVTWDMVHYDVQLVGGIALHQGKIAEMQTGEGKTLVATLPVFLNA